MNPRIPIVLAAVTTACVLAGCGSGGPTASPPAHVSHSGHATHHALLPLNPPDVTEPTRVPAPTPTATPVPGTYTLKVGEAAPVSFNTLSHSLAISGSLQTITFGRVQATNAFSVYMQNVWATRARGSTTYPPIAMTVTSTDAGTSHSYLLNDAVLLSLAILAPSSDGVIENLTVNAPSVQQTS